MTAPNEILLGPLDRGGLMATPIPHTPESETPPAATSGVSEICLEGKRQNCNAYLHPHRPIFNPST